MAERVPIEAVSAYLQAVADSNRKSEWYYDFTYSDTVATSSDDAPGLNIVVLWVIGLAVFLLFAAIVAAFVVVAQRDIDSAVRDDQAGSRRTTIA